MTETPVSIQHGNSLIDWNKVSPVLKITLSAFLVALLVVSDWAFSFIPFVQIITLLLILYTFLLGYLRTIFILACYVVIDCTVSGGMWPIFISVPLMFLAWVSLPSLLQLTHLLHCSIYKKTWLIAIIAGAHGFIFGQTFALGNTLVYYSTSTWQQFVRGYQIWALADIPWEISQCIIGIVSSIILLPLVYKTVEVVFNRYTKGV